MLRGRDFEHTLNKALDYGGKAATAYQVGKAAYAAGRFILPFREECCTGSESARTTCSAQRKGRLTRSPPPASRQGSREAPSPLGDSTRKPVRR